MPEVKDTEIKESQSVVKNLLNSLPQEEKKEEKEEEVKEKKEVQNEPETVNEKDKEESSNIEDSLVTDELAKIMDLPKGFIGKPLSEIGKSYRQSVSWGNENNQKLIQLETSLTELKGQVTASQSAKAEADANKETEKELGEIPDPVEDRPGFNKWLMKRDLLMEEKLGKVFEKKSAELLKTVNDNPTLKKAEELALARTESMIIENIQKSLPKEMKAADILDSWIEDLGDDYEYLVKTGVYKERPDKLVKDVLTWLKAQSYDNLKNQKESDITKKIHTKTKENLQRLEKVKPAIVEQKKTDEEKTETLVSKMVAGLQRRMGIQT